MTGEPREADEVASSWLPPGGIPSPQREDVAESKDSLGADKRESIGSLPYETSEPRVSSRPQLLEEDPRQLRTSPLVARWRDHPLDWLLSESLGQTALFAGTAVLLLGLGAFTWSMVGGNDDYDTSFWQSLWISWGLFFDPGTQTGVPATDPLKVQITAMLFSVCGFIFNLAVLGLIVDVIRSTLERWERIRSRIVANGHTVILGWGDKTLCLVDELRHVYMQSLEKERQRTRFPCLRRSIRGRKLVILSRRPVEEVEQEVVEQLASSGASAKDIYYRQGDPSNPLELEKVCATSADDVIVVGKQGAADVSDQYVIQTVLSLASLQGARTSCWEVWAEMRFGENVEVVDALLPACMGIVARQAVNRILCLSGILPAVGSCYVELVSFKEGNQYYVREVPEAWYGKTLGHVCCQDTGPVTVLGLHSGGDISLDMGHRFMPGDMVTVLACNSASADIAGFTACHADSRLCRRFPKPSASGDPTRYEEGRYMPTLCNKSLSTLLSGPRAFARVPAVRQTAVEPKVVCLLGCPDDIADFLLILDLYLGPGSHVWILSERDTEWRRKELRFAYNGGIDDGTEGREFVLEHVTMHDVVGPATSKRHCGRLPLEEADSVIILSEHVSDDDPTMAADARTLNTLVTLRSLCEPGHRNFESRSLPAGCTVLFEIVDSRTERVVRANEFLMNLGTPFFSNTLEMAVFATASEDRAVYNTLLVMLHPGDYGQLVITSVEPYLKPDQGAGEALSFVDLQVRVTKATNAVLVGWQRKGKKVVLNPIDKVRKLSWPRREGHSLVLYSFEMGSMEVKAEAGAEAPAPDGGFAAEQPPVLAMLPGGVGPEDPFFHE